MSLIAADPTQPPDAARVWSSRHGLGGGEGETRIAAILRSCQGLRNGPTRVHHFKAKTEFHVVRHLGRSDPATQRPRPLMVFVAELARVPTCAKSDRNSGEFRCEKRRLVLPACDT
jgi:hypothetical protein